jgi:hypothetical protein
MVNQNFIDIKERKLSTAEDFYALRAKAIAYLETHSTEEWTDFNLHDPGITILEQLCFAITDLAYRTNFDIPDLLTKENGLCDTKANAFYEASDILTTHPYYAADFARFIIDRFEAVGNAWLYPIQHKYRNEAICDVYSVVVRPDLRILRENKNRIRDFYTDLQKQVHDFLHLNRNINQLFPEVTVLKPKYIKLEAELVVEKNRDAEKILADLFHQLASYLNPRPRFFSAESLEREGLQPEQIFTGPDLHNGIIPDSELRDRKKTFSIAEITKQIIAVSGIERIRKIHFTIDNVDTDADQVSLFDDEFLALQRDEDGLYDVSGISLYINKFKTSLREEIFNLYCKQYEQQTLRQFTNTANKKPEQRAIGGKFRDIKQYFSIQNFFPATYQIGVEGPFHGSSKAERASVKQLKAYLLFFEQLLANYLMQLANVDRLYDPFIWKAPAGSYFYQPLYSVPHVAPLIKHFIEGKDESWDAFISNKDNLHQQFLSANIETGEDWYKRKNAFLHHVLARFNLNVDSYPVALFYATYSDRDLLDQLINQLEWKSGLVKNVTTITRDRFRAYSFPENTDGKSGHYSFIQMLYDLLFIRQKPMVRLTDKVLNLRYLKTTSLPGITKEVEITNPNALVSNDEWNLFLNDEQYENIVDHIYIEDQNTAITNKLIFKNKSTSFLTNAVNIGFYKISDSVNGKPVALVVYNDSGKWEIAGKFSEPPLAYHAIMRAVQQFRKASIESEGFYFLEHVLLRPPLEASVYGYQIINNAGQLKMASKNWLTAEERKKELSLLNQAGILFESDLFSRPMQGRKGFRIRYLVKSGDEIVEEDIFNNAVTVVLPEWPVRFRDSGFLRYTKQLISTELPAHIKANFLVYDLEQMRTFEDLYFNWLETGKGAEALFKIIQQANL